MVDVSDAQLWSGIASEYNDTAAHLTRRVARVAFDTVTQAIPDPSKIVDLCCGTGVLTIIAAEHFPADSGVQITATDYAQGMVSFVAGYAAAKQWRHVKAEAMDAGVRLRRIEHLCKTHSVLFLRAKGYEIQAM